jgi:hypothetical protein
MVVWEVDDFEAVLGSHTKEEVRGCMEQWRVAGSRQWWRDLRWETRLWATWVEWGEKQGGSRWRFC